MVEVKVGINEKCDGFHWLEGGIMVWINGCNQGWGKWEDDGFHGLEVGISVWVNEKMMVS